MTSLRVNKGLITCEEALQRLLDGKPVVSMHVGLDLSKLTASLVSLEAGFDRGYLKKSRKSHLPLLARIEAFRVEARKDSGSSNTKRVERLEGKLKLLEKELEMVRAQRDRVLSQNLQLWERVRGLERKLPANSTCIRLPT
ncbi:hypothetical protein JET96_14170 [Pseudomonas aeruginosa]|nr:hypothetical protein [Pseudomonas aeruginosa]MBI7098421.1 hypothetical protein [Pseudomonas aeruginosa]HEJ1290742.1 hypothetical protein [Pseudomonas aeruginosa]